MIKIGYVAVPDEYDFGTEFPTWIIGFCPDDLTWFVTNQRFFYYEYPQEFNTEQEGIDFFKNNIETFYNLENEMVDYRPSFAEEYIYLENTKEHIKIEKG